MINLACVILFLAGLCVGLKAAADLAGWRNRNRGLWLLVFLVFWAGGTIAAATVLLRFAEDRDDRINWVIPVAVLGSIVGGAAVLLILQWMPAVTRAWRPPQRRRKRRGEPEFDQDATLGKPEKDSAKRKKKDRKSHDHDVFR
jgi:hypothetical protein